MTGGDFVQGQSNLVGEFSSDNQQSSWRLLKQLSQATFCKHICVKPFSHVGARIAHHVEQGVFHIWHAFGQEKRPKLALVPLRDAYAESKAREAIRARIDYNKDSLDGTIGPLEENADVDR